jgi:uncharacterized protein with PQ loop repeat
MIEQVIGWVAVIIFCSMMIPKTTKVIQTRNIYDVNIYMTILYTIANFLGIVYATLISQAPLQLFFAISLLVNSIYLYIYYMYKTNDGEKKA